MKGQSYVTNFNPMRIFTLSTSETWEKVDVAEHKIPGNATLELAMFINTETGPFVMGVREINSSLERKAKVRKTSPFRMLTNVSPNGIIEAYTENHEETSFFIAGYWPDREYEERWDHLYPQSSNQKAIK